MSALIIYGVLAFSLLAYALTGGADFGVGILETFAPSKERRRLRTLGEQAIAPVWEANHVWILLALVIVFVAFPAVHITLVTHLHLPLLGMLVRILLRGTAFTFRYYDLDPDLQTQRLWTLLFRSGSVMVPVTFGVLAAALQRGRILPEHGTFYQTYLQPWLGLFPLATGLFTLALFAWVASVFLMGEVEEEEEEAWRARVWRWTVATVAAGALVTACAAWEEVPLLAQLSQSPLSWLGLSAASLGVLALTPCLRRRRYTLARILMGVVMLGILSGYFGAAFPVAVQHADGSRLLWTEAIAPRATLDALAVALIGASLIIFPGLALLFRIFKQVRQQAA